jgi:hypothetical protein
MAILRQAAEAGTWGVKNAARTALKTAPPPAPPGPAATDAGLEDDELSSDETAPPAQRSPS